MTVSEKNKTVLVTGATGAIGTPLTNHLFEKGYKVRVFVRDLQKCSVPDTVEIYQGDLGTGSGIDAAVKGVDIIFHLAAKLHISDPSKQVAAEYHKINVEGTQRLIDAAVNENVERFLFFSTISVYGSGKRGQTLDESSAVKPEDIYAATKVQAEQVVRKFPRNVILRPGAVYGPTMKGNYNRLVAALQKGRFFFVGDALNRRTLVYIDDLCRATVAAAEHPHAQGNVYNVTDGSMHTMHEIVEAICTALQKPLPKIHVPAAPLHFVFGLIETICKPLGIHLPVGRATIDKLTEDIAVRGDRIQKELDFNPAYDLTKGWRECVVAN